jgi:hypothetical protein
MHVRVHSIYAYRNMWTNLTRSEQWTWRVVSSGIYRHVGCWNLKDVSEEHLLTRYQCKGAAYQMYSSLIGFLYPERCVMFLVGSISIGYRGREYGHGDPLCWLRDTLHPQMLALTSSTSGGRSVGIVHSRTKAKEFVCIGSYILEEILFRQKKSCEELWNMWQRNWISKYTSVWLYPVSQTKRKLEFCQHIFWNNILVDANKYITCMAA